jgi:hypothetical protein
MTPKKINKLLDKMLKIAEQMINNAGFENE